ncbi:heme-binding protein 2 [Acanthopagrus latus]|uniref:heme-binding protein 2 n=1 Tax=Acanthopagrus latus TaxID=8177 RepID=UPI00187CE766|nr:heme-binding protein 2 [Acanthopagrus latus]XP_036946142.1 heme-binding protein 2 [Acanthopagrus latus]XP_036946143.1 heme-binding protein 2 [Acanthopagrus latus]XP_036946144.1 heme-binding protein 2 [Acanthopagrus latus]XP_036946145.1 heme-binding protein 2 [Acanthopagrus latus]XP_036946146.1 heme-binding protein 2 [Acanthopagrus latus]XP_036946147.1 heme-binding protein 2 [Acanthopagrus latus]XP_036946148.1 heme-binding protein 2 [Acanthopagrus latus]XP_036946150.1 heme-binding protein
MQGNQTAAMMMYLSGFVGFLLVLTAEARVGNSSELAFCTETEQCLVFDPVCKTPQYEVRHYGSAKWVTTEETHYIMEFASMKAFRRLFKYITGDNADGKKVEMTSPVLMKMPDDKRFWQTGVYKMGFLLPAEHQKNPPNPTDEAVSIVTLPAMKVYVKTYGGWMTSFSDKNNANSLSSALDLVGAKYKKDFHYAAGYNSPMTWFNRHNEVWYVVEDEPECSTSSEEDMDMSPFA